MDLWIIITLFAAVFQTARTALQKNLTLDLNTTGVTYARFLFGLPWAVLYVLFLYIVMNISLPQTPQIFWLFSIMAALAQIFATQLLIYLFSFRNYMIGSIYAKTEAIQTALFGMLFFNEILSGLGLLAVATGIFGIMLISAARGKVDLWSLIKGMTYKQAGIGLCSGAGFALASLCLREASLSLESESFIMQAAVTLACVLFIQSLFMGFFMTLRDRTQWPRLFRHWRQCGLIGFTSVLGSACWFTAFTLAAAAYVKTVGQIEIIFTMLVSHFIFKERIQKHEYWGIAFIVFSVFILIYET